ncbi:hypothetical protein GQX73_g6028 [Xylaria multiplex]|uniref:Uncharacterized protein n=1 Tax=Xylaria multiplex TaxID=323545 RepID=A0A7C8IRU7_9PEZI|nr:hypothetical protein GQX73_g6028 [Xylaria multiplex]
MNILQVRVGMARRNGLIRQLGESVLPLLAERPSSHSSYASEQSRLGQRFNREEILDLLSPITTKYANHIQHIANAVTETSQAQITKPVKRRLELWATNTISDKLWIQGPYEITHPSHTTFIAVFLVALANNSDVPCLSYFCSLGVHDTPEDIYPQDTLADMVKSFIVQILLLLPDDMEATPSLSRSRFEKLLHNPLDIKESMLLFRDLRALAPPYIHCVIDAAQELEDRGDRHHTENLYHVLYTVLDIPGRSGHRASVRENVVKGCVTSEGYVNVLKFLADHAEIDRIEINESEVLLAEDRPELISQ